MNYDRYLRYGLAVVILASFLVVLALILNNETMANEMILPMDEENARMLPVVMTGIHPSPTATATPTATRTPTATPQSTPGATATSSATPPPTPTSIAVPPGAIVVDHTSVALFEDIPEQYLQAAEAIHMLFIDRSVGSNINDGLTCLGYESDEAAPSHCKRWQHVDPTFSVDPSEVNWYRPGGYNRSNWDFLPWDANLTCPEWLSSLNCFVQMVNPIIGQYQVASFQFSYLAVGENSTIADLPGGFFWDNPGFQDVYDQEGYEAQHPNKVFIYWTSSLARGIGSTVSESFNQQMRAYAIANDKPLFDVADILSHDPQGNPCYDNRDGIPYDNGNNSENYPDDGLDLLAICQHYTTEVDGGHLGSVSAGKIRVAKAFWVLMARIAGWDGQ
jgi:hypothetical protein